MTAMPELRVVCTLDGRANYQFVWLQGLYHVCHLQESNALYSFLSVRQFFHIHSSLNCTALHSQLIIPILISCPTGQPPFADHLSNLIHT